MLTRCVWQAVTYDRIFHQISLSSHLSRERIEVAAKQKELWLKLSVIQHSLVTHQSSALRVH